MESEKNIEKYLVGKVNEMGGMCIKIPAIHHAGIPDRLILIPMGIIFFAEIKTTKNKPRKLQLLVHRKLRKIGFRVEVIDTTQQIREILRDYAN